MPTVRRATSEAWHERKKELLERVGRKGIEFTLDGRRGARSARGGAGTLFLPAASESQPDRWWLGLNERVFLATGDVRGVVLLCASGNDVLDFWFPAEEVRALLPRLSIGANDERKFNVVRRRGRYWLQIPGEGEVEISARRGDTSWLVAGPARAESPTPLAPQGLPPAVVEHAFFAKVRRGRLEPLDPLPLEEGTVVAVRATLAAGVPRAAALRKIVAGGGPAELPPDFADQHDHYAHGTPRR